MDCLLVSVARTQVATGTEEFVKGLQFDAQGATDPDRTRKLPASSPVIYRVSANA
jgi:hypothetical protein